MKRFENKVAIITGGASGIGESVVKLFVEEGGRAVIGDINHDQGLAMAGRSDGNIHFVKTDVTKENECRQLVENTCRTFGKVDFLCNSAGLQTYGTAESTTSQQWDSTLDVNLKSMFLMSKYTIPEIRKQGGGAIVNISSVQGLSNQENVVAYATSKGAAISLTRAMAIDHAKEKIRINAICPGSIDTPLLRFGAAEHGNMEQVLKEWGSHHPIGRVGNSDEIGKPVLFLFSEDAGFIVGQCLVVDGGLISKIL